MRSNELHRLVRRGDIEGVREFLNRRSREKGDVNTFDAAGSTPLMYAVQGSRANPELVRTLLDAGANVHQHSKRSYQAGCSVLALALNAGDPRIVASLIEAGADLRYQREGGYDALIDAVHGRDLTRDDRLIELLHLLVAKTTKLDSITQYSESALLVLSSVGRFDALRVLLDAGADGTRLRWTPIFHAIAFGSLDDVERLIGEGAPLEEKDWWGRTPWLLAIHAGDLQKAQLLHRHGANTKACGACAKPPMTFAVESHHPHVLRWLIDLGLDLEQGDEFESTALMAAAESSDLKCLDILLGAGAKVDRVQNGETALSRARSRDVAMRLLEAGADPRYLRQEGRRVLLGLEPEPDADLLDVSPEDFRRAQTRRFGQANPELMDEPFWRGMIRAGITGYDAAASFGGRSSLRDPPVWCAQRFGQSITFLSDGRIVQIGGEHEDSYDPDFCIYNDVFVHEPGGAVHIYGYPESVFPPTDFHTATLVGDFIYVIGSIGYHGARRFGETPVYRLDTRTWRIEPVKASGDGPGWLHEHRAVLSSPDEITVSGGKIGRLEEDGEVYEKNAGTFVLDLRRLVWRALN
jgi:ankyrin repeat protein